jgi:hypothetical protein
MCSVLPWQPQSWYFEVENLGTFPIEILDLRPVKTFNTPLLLLSHCKVSEPHSGEPSAEVCYLDFLDALMSVYLLWVVRSLKTGILVSGLLRYK